MTVAELRDALAALPDDLQVGLTTTEFFPWTRQIKEVKAVQALPPHDAGVVALMGGVPGAILKTKSEQQGEVG